MIRDVIGQKNGIAVHEVRVVLNGYNVVLAVVLQRHKVGEQGFLVHNELAVTVIAGRQKPDQRLHVCGGKRVRLCNGNAVGRAPSVRVFNALRLGRTRAVDKQIFDFAGDSFRQHIDDPAFKRGNAHSHYSIGNLNQLDDLITGKGNGGQRVSGGGNACVLGVDRGGVVRAFDRELYSALDVQKSNFIQHRRKRLYLADNLVRGLRRDNLRARAAGVAECALLCVVQRKAANVFQPRGTIFGRTEGIIGRGVVVAVVLLEGTGNNARALRDIVKNAVALLGGGNQSGALFGKLGGFLLQRVNLCGGHSVAALFDLLLDSRKAGFDFFNSHCVKPPSLV